MNKHIINDDGTVNLVEFQINGIRMALVGTESGLYSDVLSAIDTWKTEYPDGRKEYLKIKRKDMFNKTRQSIIIFDELDEYKTWTVHNE